MKNISEMTEQEIIALSDEDVQKNDKTPHDGGRH